MWTIHLTFYRYENALAEYQNSTLLAQNSLHTIGNSTDILAFNFWRYKACLWPRAVPLVCTKIPSCEIVGANRLAYPSGQESAQRQNAKRDISLETSLLEMSRKREVQEFSFHEEGNWEKTLQRGWKRAVGCPTRDRNNPGRLPWIRFCSRCSWVVGFCIMKLGYNQSAYLVSMRGTRMESNRAEPNRRGRDSATDYDRSFMTLSIARHDIHNLGALPALLHVHEWNMTPVDIVSAAETSYVEENASRYRTRK